MSQHHHATLCAAPHCRVRGQHTTDCPGGDCRGCLPRPAADGLALCWPHTEWLERDARQAAWLYGELEHVLIGAPAFGGRVSGSPDRTRLPNMAAVEARTLIRHTLVSWCRLIAEERGIDLPRDEVAAMGDYIARHAHWLAAHPAAGEAAADLREASLAATVAQACAIANYTENDAAAGLADAGMMATTQREFDGWHPWAVDAQQAVEIALACEQAGRDVDARIGNSDGASVNTHASLSVYANSHGFLGAERGTSHTIGCALIAGEGDAMQRDGWFDVALAHADLADPAGIGRKPVARLTAVARPRKPIDAELLRSLTTAMPPQSQSAGDLVRSMRDGDRY